MKYLVTYLFDDYSESAAAICCSLDDAISFVKERSIFPYTADKYKIYCLQSPLTVRYLDNKIFID